MSKNAIIIRAAIATTTGTAIAACRPDEHDSRPLQTCVELRPESELPAVGVLVADAFEAVGLLLTVCEPEDDAEFDIEDAAEEAALLMAEVEEAMLEADERRLLALFVVLVKSVVGVEEPAVVLPVLASGVLVGVGGPDRVSRRLLVIVAIMLAKLAESTLFVGVKGPEEALGVSGEGAMVIMFCRLPMSGERAPWPWRSTPWQEFGRASEGTKNMNRSGLRSE